jgi:hypothetical protein
LPATPRTTISPVRDGSNPPLLETLAQQFLEMGDVADAVGRLHREPIIDHGYTRMDTDTTGTLIRR